MKPLTINYIENPSKTVLNQRNEYIINDYLNVFSFQATYKKLLKNYLISP